MQQLTGLDASFLALETANTTGHVGGLSVLDPKGTPKPLNLARLTEVLAQRLPKPITPHRRFAFRSVDLEVVRVVKNTFGVSAGYLTGELDLLTVAAEKRAAEHTE